MVKENLIKLIMLIENMRLLRIGVSECADHMISCGVTIPVRCKDCKHTRKKNGHEQFMYNENVCICTKEDIWGITKNEPVWDDGFCSYGERKDND